MEENIGIWRRLSLVQKSTLVGTLLLIANSVALTLTFTNIQERYQIRALEDEGAATARSIAEVSKYGVVTRNVEVLDDQLQGMITKNVSSIELIDNQGDKISKAVGSRIPLFDIKETRKKARTASSPFTDKVHNNSGELVAILMVHPIEMIKKGMREEVGLLSADAGSREKIGAVIVTMNAEQVYSELEANRNTYFGLALAFLAVGIPVVIFFVHITAKPLKKLVVATQKMAEGDLTYKVDVASSDEIGDLARSFNIMGEKLQETQERLIMNERLAASGRLAADVAHEINNPLAIMKNYIYVLMKKKLSPDDPAQQTLAVIDGEINRVARIITQFNDFFTGSDNPIEEIDLLDPIRDVMLLFRECYEGIEIEERLTDVGKVVADKDKLKQVFLNILKNAYEATPEGGRIVIETAKEHDNIAVSISDTGTGISRENINRIFDPFFSTKGIKGVGLGLAVSYGIIKSLNGEIQVKSDVGVGTTFKVTLPAVSA